MELLYKNNASSSNLIVLSSMYESIFRIPPTR
jgi:hypothetical protein